MNVTIDANATFNPLGEIKPLYVRLEDENHELHTYKIESIEQVKEENKFDFQNVITYTQERRSLVEVAIHGNLFKRRIWEIFQCSTIQDIYR